MKFGSGAFMRTRAAAECTRQRAMIEVGHAHGRVHATRGSPRWHEPLGRTVGNALEVRGMSRHPSRRRTARPDRTDPGSLPGRSPTRPASRSNAGSPTDPPGANSSESCDAQGGDLGAFEKRVAAPVIAELRADRSGILKKVDAGVIGRAAMALGAGRNKADDAIDSRVGFDEILKTGSSVAAGGLLLRIHATSSAAAESAVAQLQHAFTLEA